MNNSIKAFCDLECVKTIAWMIMVLLCWIGIFAINFAILHDFEEAFIYCVTEVSIFGVTFFLGSVLVFCILSTRHEFLSKRSKLDLCDQVNETITNEEIIIV
jgi:hypothetical protein